MKQKLKDWFSAPVFSGDEGKTYIAGLLNAITLTVLFLILVVILGNLIGGKIPAMVLFIDSLMLVAAVLFRHWLQKGRIKLTGAGLISTFFVFITWGIANLGSIRTPTTAAYLLIVIVAGILFELRGILISTLASSLAVLAMIMAENAGILPKPDYSVTYTQWITYTALFGLTGLMTFSAHQVTKKALARSKMEVHERERAEMELRKLIRAVEQSPASIVITDLDGIIEYVNPRFTQVTGYTAEESVGQNPRILKSDLTPQETHLSLWTTLTSWEEWHGEFVNRKKDGSLYYESARISPITDQNGVVTHYLAVKEDITEQKQAEETLKKVNAELITRVEEIEHLQAELRELSLRDPLTGLYNRRYLTETLAKEISRSQRENIPLSIIISDIDHFKGINDAYGHQVGDQFLVAISDLLKNNTRGSDIICRYGGEEFLIVLPDTSSEDAARRADTLRQKCSELIIRQHGLDLKVTASFGIATYPKHGHDPEEIIIKADNALYKSKHAGRNRVTVWNGQP